jgi:hypothetical protein
MAVCREVPTRPPEHRRVPEQAPCAARCRGPLRRATERGAGRAPPILTRRLELQVGGQRGRLSAPPRRWRLGTRGACPRCGGPSGADARQRGPYPHGWASVQPARPRRVPPCSAPGEGVGLARDSPPSSGPGPRMAHGFTAGGKRRPVRSAPAASRRPTRRPSTDWLTPRRTAGRWRCDRAPSRSRHARCPMPDSQSWTARKQWATAPGEPFPFRIVCPRCGAVGQPRRVGRDPPGTASMPSGWKTPIALPAVGVFPYRGGSSLVRRS